jgi:acyl CoA:acetate/3-ketoacid CoA transferase beta subunit
MADEKYTLTDLMIIAAAKELPDGEAVLVGTGLPVAAALFAQKTHAPRLLLCFEAGGVGPESVPRLPLTVGEGITAERAVEAASMIGIMSMAARGVVKYGFLGGAQIDMYGNLNSTVIGSHASPKMRFPGSGGANDIGSLCTHTVIIMKHEKRRFIPKIDFVTTPGYLSGGNARELAGLPENTGPYRVISTLAIMGFEPGSKKMELLKLYPGVSARQVQDETGFELLVSKNLQEIDAPSEEEIRILRTDVDPFGALEFK